MSTNKIGLLLVVGALSAPFAQAEVHTAYVGFDQDTISVDIGHDSWPESAWVTIYNSWGDISVSVELESQSLSYWIDDNSTTVRPIYVSNGGDWGTVVLSELPPGAYTVETENCGANIVTY